MKLQNIKVALAYESATNPRGKNFEGPAFDDLVASVKEKGVLVPVIARPNKKGNKEFEIVAGNRKFRAAQKVGLEEIPARVEEMTDEQAREVQIIENLQREDVHPIEEGQAYRRLVEESKYSVDDIAQRVGKSESYVRYRLFLTNLNDKVAKAFRKGELTDGHAVLLAKLSQGDQLTALKWIKDEWELPTVKDLKEWIEKTFYNQLDNQPWLNDKDANEAVGACKECQPNRNSLFGEVKEGACTDLKCWKRKMGKYIDYIMAKKEINVKVSKEYGKTESKDILSRSDYEMLSTNKKKQCDNAQTAIVAEGADLGTIVYICTDPKCKTHGKNHASYALTPEEKKKRKEEFAKEKAKEKARIEKEDNDVLRRLENIQLPITPVTLDILFNLFLKRSYLEESLKVIARRHGWEVIVEDQESYMDKNKIRKVKNWDKTIRERYAELEDEQKLRLIVEIMAESLYEPWEMFKKIIKKGV